MAVDLPNSNNLPESLVAAGGNSRLARSLRVKSQLRDKYGRWVEMGRDSKLNFTDALGKLATAVGKFIGTSDRQGYGRFYVENGPNGTGVYEFPSASIEQVAATLDEAYLLSKNIDVNGNKVRGIVADDSIPKVAELVKTDLTPEDRQVLDSPLTAEEQATQAQARLDAPAYESKDVIAKIDAADIEDMRKNNIDWEKYGIPTPAGFESPAATPEIGVEPLEDVSFDRFVKDNGGILNAAKKLLESNPDSSSLKSDIDFIERNGYSDSEITDSIKSVFDKTEKSSATRDAAFADLEKKVLDAVSGGDESKIDAAKSLLSELRDSKSGNEVNGVVAKLRDMFRPTTTEDGGISYGSKANSDAALALNGFEQKFGSERRLPRTPVAVKDTAFDDFVKQNGGLSNAAKKLLEQNPSNADALRETVQFIERNGYSVEDDRAAVKAAFDEVGKSAPAAREVTPFDNFVEESGGLGKAAERLLEQNPSNAADLRDTLKFIERNGYSESDDRDAVKAAFREVGDKVASRDGSLEDLQKTVTDAFRGEPKGATAGEIFNRLNAAFEADDKDAVAEEINNLQRLFSYDPEDGFGSKAKNDAWSAISKFKQTNDIPEAPSVVKARGEVDKRFAEDKKRAEESKAAFDKFVEENGGLVNTAKKLLEQNPSNASDLMDTIRLSERNGYTTSEDTDAVKAAFREVGDKVASASVNDVFKKLEDAGVADINNPNSSNEDVQQARDTALYMSDLIEEAALDGGVDKADLYNRLGDALVEHFKNKDAGNAASPKVVGKADTIQKITGRKEGATLDPNSLSQPRQGIAVALENTNEEIIDTIFFDDKLGDLALAKYLDQNMSKFRDGFKLGTWHDKDNNEVTLDVVEIFPESDREAAQVAGQQRNQQGIFVISNKEYIPTGGTGDRGRARREREQARQSGDGVSVAERLGEPVAGREDRGGESVAPADSGQSAAEQAVVEGIDAESYYISRFWSPTATPSLDEGDFDFSAAKVNLQPIIDKASEITDILVPEEISVDDVKRSIQNLKTIVMLFTPLRAAVKPTEVIQAVQDLRTYISDAIGRARSKRKVSLDTRLEQVGSILQNIDQFTAAAGGKFKPAKPLTFTARQGKPNLSGSENLSNEVFDVLQKDNRLQSPELTPDLNEYFDTEVVNAQNPDEVYAVVERIAETVSEKDTPSSVMSSLRDLVNRNKKKVVSPDSNESKVSPRDFLKTPLFGYAQFLVDEAKLDSEVLDKVVTSVDSEDLEEYVRNLRALGGRIKDIAYGQVSDYNLSGSIEETKNSEEYKMGQSIQNFADKVFEDNGFVVMSDPSDGLRLSGMDTLLSTVEIPNEVAIPLRRALTNISGLFTNRKYAEAAEKLLEFEQDFLQVFKGDNFNEDALSFLSRLRNNISLFESQREHNAYASGNYTAAKSTKNEISFVDAVDAQTQAAAVRTLSAERIGTLDLNVRRIDKSKMNERQKKVLSNLTSRRNAAMKAMEEFAKNRDYVRYEQAYMTSAALTESMRSLVAGVEERGNLFSFGSGELERVKNFYILEDKIETDPVNGQVTSYEAVFINKNGRPYLIKYNGYAAKAYSIEKDGTPSASDAGYCSVHHDGEYSYGEDYPRPATIGVLEVYPRHREGGLGAAVVTGARLGAALNGKEMTHSNCLSFMGANNSKGIDRHDHRRHHYSQAERVLELMNAPYISNMTSLGWFSPSFNGIPKRDMYGNEFELNGKRKFDRFLEPIDQTGQKSYGRESMEGPLYHIDMSLNKIAADLTSMVTRVRASDRNATVESVVPELFVERVKAFVDPDGDSLPHLPSFGIQELVTDMQFKGGISKEDGLAQLQRRVDALTEVENSIPKFFPERDETRLAIAQSHIRTLRNQIASLHDSIRDDESYDSRRIDYPANFPLDEFPRVKQSAYGNITNNEKDILPKLEGISENLSSLLYNNKRHRLGHTGDYAVNTGKESDIAYDLSRPNRLAVIFDSETLKSALRTALSNAVKNSDNSTFDPRNNLDDRRDADGLVDNGYAAVVEFGREFGETESYQVDVRSVVNALYFQGVDVKQFAIDTVDELTNSTKNRDANALAQESPERLLLNEMNEFLQSRGESVDGLPDAEAPQLFDTGGRSLLEADRIAFNANNDPSNLGSYDRETGVVTNRYFDPENPFDSRENHRRNSSGYGADMPYPLMENERFDLDNGEVDVLGGTYSVPVQNTLDARTQGLTPPAIARLFNRDDLVNAFVDSLNSYKDHVTLRFNSISPAEPLGREVNMPLTAIRDALQNQGVDTNALVRQRVNTLATKTPNTGESTPFDSIKDMINVRTITILARTLKVSEETGEVTYEDLGNGRERHVKQFEPNPNAPKNSDRAAAAQEFVSLTLLNAMNVKVPNDIKRTHVESDYDYSNRGSVRYVHSISYDRVETGDKTYAELLAERDPKTLDAARDGLIADLLIDQIDGAFNPSNNLIDKDGNVVRIDGGGALLNDPVNLEGEKAGSARFYAGGFPDGNPTPEQMELLERVRKSGSFLGDDGIEFGFDYYLNPNGWHWKGESETRAAILDGFTEEDMKARVERLIAPISPRDLAYSLKESTYDLNEAQISEIVETLINRRKRILERFGVEDPHVSRSNDTESRANIIYGTNSQRNELTNIAELNKLTVGATDNLYEKMREEVDINDIDLIDPNLRTNYDELLNPYARLSANRTSQEGIAQASNSFTTVSELQELIDKENARRSKLKDLQTRIQNVLAKHKAKSKDETPETAEVVPNSVDNQIIEEISQENAAALENIKNGVSATAILPRDYEANNIQPVDVNRLRFGSILLQQEQRNLGDATTVTSAKEIGRVMFVENISDGNVTVGYIDADKNLKIKSFNPSNDSSYFAIHEPAANRPVESNFDGSLDQRQAALDVRNNTIKNDLAKRSNGVKDDIKRQFPNAVENSDGNLVIASNTYQTSRGDIYKYDVVVHRKPNEEFVAYVRETPVDADGNPIGDPIINKMSPQTHSSLHLTNQINNLLRGNSAGKGIFGTNPRNWFNQGNKREAEVIHPATGMPVPRSLAPENLDSKFIGSTGIESTKNPVKDAVIGYVADLVDRGVADYAILNRLAENNILSNSEIMDVLERTRANRAFPGVTAIPYMSADGKNIVRVGDRVRHVDGRMGVVRVRRPLSVNRKSQGQYGYTDVLVVKFDGRSQGTPIVAKNLNIVRRADGSEPLLEVVPEPLTSPYLEPVLPVGFSHRDASPTVREYVNSIGQTVANITAGNDISGNRMFTARTFRKNRANGVVTFNRNDAAQSYIENLMRNPRILSRMQDINAPTPPVNSRAGQSSGDAPEPESLSIQSPAATPNLDGFDDKSSYNETEREAAEALVVDNSKRNYTMFSFPGLFDDAGKQQVFVARRIKGKMVIYYGSEKGVTRDAKSRTLEPTGSMLFEDGDSIESIKDAVIREMGDRKAFDAEGSHVLTLPYRGKELKVDLDYGAWYGLKTSPISRDGFIRNPETGEITLTPERAEEIVAELDSHLDGVKKPEGAPTLTFLSGLPASGKGGFSKKGKDLNKQYNIPSTRQFRESDALESSESTDSPEAVLIDPDILKMRMPEVRVRHFRQLANLFAKKKGVDSLFEDSQEDDKWANQSHEESSLRAKMLLQAATNEGLNVVYDGTNNNRKKVQEIMGVAANNNPDYRFKMHGLLVDPRETMPTAVNRGADMGRIVPTLPQITTVLGLTEAMADGDSPKNRMWDAAVEVTLPDGTKEMRGFDEFTLNGRKTPSDAPWSFPQMAKRDPETGELVFVGDTEEEKIENENFWLGFTNVSADEESKQRLVDELSDIIKNAKDSRSEADEVAEAQAEALASLAAIFSKYSDLPGISSAEFDSLSPQQAYAIIDKFVNGVKSGDVSLSDYNKYVNDVLEHPDMKDFQRNFKRVSEKENLGSLVNVMKHLDNLGKK